jgi:hypothetical protein
VASSLAALAKAGPASAGRAHVAVGRAPLCIRAERGFGPEALKLIFLFSDLFNSLQIQKFVYDSFELRKL